MNDTGFDKIKDEFLLNKIKRLMKFSDLVLVTDYNHGIISFKNANFISKKKIFLFERSS